LAEFVEQQKLGVVTGGELLPGFRVPVSEIFAR